MNENEKKVELTEKELDRAAGGIATNPCPKCTAELSRNSTLGYDECPECGWYNLDKFI